MSIGLKLKQVYIAGRARTSEVDIEKIVSAIPDMDIMKVDIYKIRENLKKLPWIKDVKIKRILPQHLVIEVYERSPIAVFKHNDKFNPIDDEGNIIEVSLNKPSGLPIITGTASPENVPHLFQILKQEDDLFRRVKGASWIGKRRWDIYIDDLTNGIIVKLPQKNFQIQWSHLSRINKEQQILDKDIHSIDLRDPEKSMINMDIHKTKSKTKTVREEQDI
ncbi:MAG: FtsQ-type POTRA domain-containing protein [Alphaproteobacteria bacterium]|nr:FtsQ-type POTRA domain-containing protein [Alphaproteobacteria bacterium]